MGRVSSAPGSVWLVLIVCGAMLTVASALDGSGQGESTYEEYEDEGVFHRDYQTEDLDSLEDFADHADVLDPISDDDISYSGYDYEEPLDGNGATAVSAAVVTPSTESVLLHDVVAIGNNDTFSETADNHSTLAKDGQSTPLPGGNVTGMLDPTSTIGPPDVNECCRDRQKLPTQPTFLSRDASVIRMCCPRGESLMNEHSKYVSCQRYEPSAMPPRAIVAQFYQDCIEDLEEDIQLNVRVGHPCQSEGALVSFGERTNDTLYVIQNGSLLVIYGVHYYDVYDTYCLDYSRDDGTLVAYVCPSEVRVMMDFVKGQLFLLTICLIVAIPALLLTAALYILVPRLHDLHGRALALNSLNFAAALLLECFFQYRNRGKRMLMDDMVLENYAEYFILATFFWLLVNCANNCFHAWYYIPARKKFSMREENQRFAVYAAFAQLIPLWIILCYSKTASGTPAIKHYLFIPIGVTMGLGLICLLATLVGLSRLMQSYYDCCDIWNRLLREGRTDEVYDFVPVSGRKVNKVVYMSKYTVPLFTVMAINWTVMAVTYYTTYELPIFYDILFGFQGILMFIIFVCMPRPWDAIREWFLTKRYCMWMFQTDPVVEPTAEEQAPIVRQFAPTQMARMAVVDTPPEKPAQMARMPAAYSAHVSNTNAFVPEPRQIKRRSRNPFTYVEET